MRASLMEEICAILGDAMPKHWQTAALTLTPTAKGFGNNLTHEISSPEGHAEMVQPPTELLQATKRLERYWVENEATFKQAVISATRDSKVWHISIDYDL